VAFRFLYFFTDGRSARPLVENTVARGAVVEDEMAVGKESNAFPIPLNMDLLERGENRYKIYCSPATVCRETATAWWPCVG